MSPAHLYRTDLKEAVRIFRPVLQGLKVRSNTEHPIVFFAAFDQLINLSLDECSIQVIVAEMTTQGIFFFKRTKQGSLRAFIVLNKMLYDNPKKEMKELLKVAAVHEFVHFLAVVYVATITPPGELRIKLLDKLQHIIQKLPGEELLNLYYGIKKEIPTDTNDHSDTHFRLNHEGQTPDYYLLFLHLMFSRELFETYFNEAEQREFKNLMRQGNDQEAIQLLLRLLNTAAEDKNVPVQLALSQLMEWVHVYMR